MKRVIVEFDKYLTQFNIHFEFIIIGGAALNILDISSRKTRDVDCLDPEIPADIKKLSQKFSQERLDLNLDEDWLNNGPQSLKIDLPKNWRLRTIILLNGRSLIIKSLGRSDLLKTKLFAYCDRTTPDFEDLIELKPSRDELSESIGWVKERDQNVSWPKHVETAFDTLRKALKHE